MKRGNKFKPGKSQDLSKTILFVVYCLDRVSAVLSAVKPTLSDCGSASH
jgi:hypothetical protein